MSRQPRTEGSRVDEIGSARTLVVSWTRVGGIAGISAALVYPLLIAVPLPDIATLVLAAAFGPLLSVASIGLYRFLAAQRETVTLQIAAVANVIAGTVVNLMMVVQLAIRHYATPDEAVAGMGDGVSLWKAVYGVVDAVQLGLDVSWDVYIGLGTFLFALNMVRHPRLGRIMGWSGMLIAVLLLIFNFSTFPLPPAGSGSVDVGPLVGLWYFVVSILVLRSIGWLVRRETPVSTE